MGWRSNSLSDHRKNVVTSSLDHTLGSEARLVGSCVLYSCSAEEACCCSAGKFNAGYLQRKSGLKGNGRGSLSMLAPVGMGGNGPGTSFIAQSARLERTCVSCWLCGGRWGEERERSRALGIFVCLARKCMTCVRRTADFLTFAEVRRSQGRAALQAISVSRFPA